MKRFLWVWVAALLLSGPLARGQGDKPAAAPAAPATPAAKPDQPQAGPVVTLLEAGAEPRRVYRYAPAVGSKQTLNMSMKITSRSEVDGKKGPSQSQPEILMSMLIEVAALAPNGDITYDMTFTKAEIGEVSGTPPAVVEQMRKSLGTMVGLKGRTTLTNRGETKEANLTVPDNADATLKQTVESMKGSVRQLSTPLPVEALGVGGKWQVVNHMTSSGITMDQTATMTITRAEADAVDIAVVVKQTAPEQAIKGGAAGTKTTLMGAEGEGEGKMTASIASVVPVESSMRIQTQQRMAVVARGESRQMKQDMIARIVMKTEPAK